MKTITIKEFKNLSTAGAPSRTEAFGRFALSAKVQRVQCENLKAGDKVFFMETEDKGIGEDEIPQVNINLVQATVVE